MGTGPSFRQLCFNVGILLDMFLLSVRKTEETQKGNGSLAVVGKNEMSLGNASRALVSHLGWEKALARA